MLTRSRVLGFAVPLALLATLSGAFAPHSARIGNTDHQAEIEPDVAVARSAPDEPLQLPEDLPFISAQRTSPIDADAGVSPEAAASSIGVYAATTMPLRPDLADIAPRVYVPNEQSASVSVIDPATMRVVREIKVGRYPQHVAPSPDLTRLYVNDEGLTEIDARTGAVLRIIRVPMPYNLYFTPDGRRAIVVAEDLDRLDFYDLPGWTLVRSVRIPWKGIDHLDFSDDGTYLIGTTEYAGVVVKVDLRELALSGSAKVASLPVDVRLSPDGSVFYITDQGRHGVILFDGVAMREVGFIATGRGAHGLAISRDTRSLYVSNRLAGTITVVDAATNKVTAQWNVGGSPDMLQVSIDGRQLWTGDRYSDSVAVVDTTSGKVTARIKVGRAPHGLTYFPQPGRISLGHNGVYR